MVNDEQIAALAALRDQLADLQQAQIAHGRRAIILLEGPPGSGKKATLRQLASALDPCHFAVHECAFDRREAARGHWLACFWAQLPVAGSTAIFFRSWYRRVLDDRIVGRIDDGSVPRTFDEINEFEAQQRDYGTLIVKLYFTVPEHIQRQRLEAGANGQWSSLRREEPIVVGDPGYARAFADLQANSDTRWSPWKLIDGSDEGQGTVAALDTVVEAWSRTMPAEPPQLVQAGTRLA